MSDLCIVLIGATEILPALQQRAGDANGEVLAFSDKEVLDALKTIVKRRPGVVVFERMFAMTSRGAALINRIKVDPALRQSEIRVLAHDGDYSRVVPRAPAPGPPALDQRGTRRAPRFRISDKVMVYVDGKSAALVDLSTVGAHVLASGMLKPNQQVAVAFADATADVRCTAAVAWTKFEILPTGAPRYRAGLDFTESDPAAVDAYCERHRA